jgi:hypothetical protein
MPRIEELRSGTGASLWLPWWGASEGADAPAVPRLLVSH